MFSGKAEWQMAFAIKFLFVCRFNSRMSISLLPNASILIRKTKICVAGAIELTEGVVEGEIFLKVALKSNQV